MTGPTDGTAMMWTAGVADSHTVLGMDGFGCVDPAWQRRGIGTAPCLAGWSNARGSASQRTRPKLLVVRREYRGRGIAQALLADAIRRFTAAGMDVASLAVNRSMAWDKPL